MIDVWAEVHNTMAQEWHAASDHARDGSPFGGFLCNCDRVTKRAIELGWVSYDAYDKAQTAADREEQARRSAREEP